MNAHELKPQHWYWIRRRDGTIAPYQFHRLASPIGSNQIRGEFFVGSMIQVFSIGHVVGEAARLQ